MRNASKSATRTLRNLTNAALAVLIAPLCAACGDSLNAPLSGAICATCWSRIHPLTEPLCRICGDALRSWRTDDGISRLCTRCAKHPRLITMGRAVGAYEGTLRDVLHVLKYDRRRSVARILGRLMAQSGARVLDGADFLVPVPLHFWRHYRRGFNQASELARHVGVRTVNALRRRRPTATQTDLPEAERHRNVHDAFVVRYAARAPLQNAVVVVVDDVSTTGATLDACAAVLLSVGAKEVRALTAARAVSRLR
jgi:ComF family protein